MFLSPFTACFWLDKASSFKPSATPLATLNPHDCPHHGPL
jgi:hypothetical protein